MVGSRLLSMGFLALTILWGVSMPEPGVAQVVWQDLVFTGGVSAEGYRGNLPAVTVTAVDCVEDPEAGLVCTEEASSVVGEFGLRGRVTLLNREERAVDLRFDTGLRQFVAGGFQVRDYAPKELVGRVDLTYRENVGSVGELWVFGGAARRKVDDRPPMPLFIQPGFSTVDGRIQLSLNPINDVAYDVQLFGEMADYGSTRLTPQLALLDRRVLGLELGALWGSDWTVRGHAGFRLSEYRNQGTYDPSDPLRRDRTLNLGATWTYQSSFLAEVGVEGIVNRSNSSRPEYNALSLEAFALVPLPNEVSLNFFADLTVKRYLTDTGDALLVPGEEADNASVVYVEASRPLLMNLDGAVRFSWTRAETDIGTSYYERFGASFLFRYRPWE